MGDSLENRAKAYCRQKYLLRFLDIIITLSFLLAIQLAGLSTYLKNIFLSLNNNFYVSLGAYLLCLNLIYYLISFPLDFYNGFVLEHKFSLSNLTLKAFLKDEFKKVFLGFLIFSAVIELLYAIPKHFTAYWWLTCAVLWVGLGILFAKVFPVLIIPIFYKYKPLRSDSLKNKILEMAKRMGVKVLNACEIELSKKTKKSNAAIVGFGKTKRIILADNLVSEFTPAEVEVVVAHEIAHHKFKHLWKLVLFSAISATLFFYILSRILGNLATILGAEGPFDISIFPAIWLFFIVYEIVMMSVYNAISRRMEYSADLAALKATNKKEAFISLMERLAEKNLSEKSPNRFIELVFYDHPPIAKRIDLAKRF